MMVRSICKITTMSSKAAVSRATRITRLSARIFGEVVRKTSQQDQKVVQMFSRFPWQRHLPSWYPPFPNYNRLLLRLRHVGLYRDEHLDFKERMDIQRRKRGKEAPRKGEGKRSKSKK